MDKETEDIINSLSSRIEELESFIYQHIGEEIGAVGTGYPHPNMRVNSIFFGDEDYMGDNLLHFDIPSNNTDKAAIDAWGDSNSAQIGDIQFRYDGTQRVLTLRARGTSNRTASLALGAGNADNGSLYAFLQTSDSGSGGNFVSVADDDITMRFNNIDIVQILSSIFRIEQAFLTFTPTTGLPPDESIYTISSGAITPKRTHVVVNAESGTSDDLDTLTATNAETGSIVILRAASGDTITIKDGTGNISAIGSDFAMSGDETWMGMYDGTNWIQLSSAGSPF